MTISSQGVSLDWQAQDTQEIDSNPRMGNRRWIFHNSLLKQGRELYVNSRLLREVADPIVLRPVSVKNFISTHRAGGPRKHQVRSL